MPLKHPYFSFITLSISDNLYLPIYLLHPIPTCLISSYYYLIERHTLLFSLYLSILTISLSYPTYRLSSPQTPLPSYLIGLARRLRPTVATLLYLLYILSLPLIGEVGRVNRKLYCDCPSTVARSHSHPRSRRSVCFVRSQ